jgi:hypothetical protein
MSTYERSIVSIIEPDYKGKIKLDEIFVEDTESKEAKEKSVNVAPTPYKTSSRAGAFVPMIYINTHKFSEDELQSMEVSMNGRIPTISARLCDNDNKFAISPPIDGDVISLYLRPPDADNQKPIRIDFYITSINSSVKDRIYNVNGQMKIPQLYREYCKSFPNANSFDHLQDVCEQTGLGFASNEESTDDSMPRICGFDTYETFVNDIVFTSYKDDDSFFDWYIDPYYYLCFVNVNKQFSLEDKTEDVNISSSIPASSQPDIGDTGPAEDNIKGSLILTNNTTMGEKNVFINRYSVENRSGNVWLSNGYKRYGQWLNIGSENEVQEAFTDPLTTKGAETDYILLKGRKSDGDFYNTMSKSIWLGKQAPYLEKGNVHDNYTFSKIHNHQNLEEITKTTLEVELSGMNFYIYKYMRIPVAIYESGNPKNQELLKGRNEALGEDNKNSEAAKNTPLGKIAAMDMQPTDEDGTPKQTDQVKNELLSGYYVVTGIRFNYAPDDSPSMLKMCLTLSRREWPIPAKNKDV